MKTEVPIRSHRASGTALCLGLALLIGSASASTPPAYKHVLVVESSAGGPYEEFAQGFESSLRAAVPVGGVSIEALVLDASGANAPGDSTADTLVVAVGTRATEAMLGRHGDSPLLCVLVPRVTYMALAEKAGQNGGPSVGIYLDQPLTRYLALAKLLLPDLKRVGVILGPATQGETEELKPAASRAGLQLSLARLKGPDDNPLPALDALLQDSGAILALPDPAVYNRYSLPPLLLTSFRYHLPVIGFSRSLVEAGALAAVYSEPSDIASQAASMAANGLPDSDGFYPESFHVRFNEAVARSLEIKLPSTAEAETRLAAGERAP